MKIQLLIIVLATIIMFTRDIQAGDDCLTEVALDTQVESSAEVNTAYSNLYTFELNRILDIDWIYQTQQLVVVTETEPYILSVNNTHNVISTIVCNSRIQQFEFANTGDFAIGSSGEVTVYGQNGTVISTNSLHENSLIWLGFAPNGDILAVSSSHVNEEFGYLENNRITLIPLDSDGEIINFNTNVSAVINGWFLAHNSSLILSGYNTGLEGLEIQLWDVASVIQEWDLTTFTETLELPRIPFVTAVAASDEIIAMAIRTSTGVQNEYGETLIYLYSPMTLELQGVLELGGKIITSLTFHPEESLLVIGSNTGTIDIWNFVTQEIISIDVSTTTIESIIYLDNRTFAIISDGSHTLSIWRDTTP